MRSRTGSDGGHILVGGTGRAGTTLLVQYFTTLGFDTGFTAGEARRVNPIANAGLEHALSNTLAKGRPLPYVAKSPWFSLRLSEYLARGDLEVLTFVLPVRDLHDAAASRQRVAQAATDAGLDPRGHPGALTIDAAAPARQQKHLAQQFHQLVHTLVEHDIDIRFLPFPSFAWDPDVLFARLAGLLADHGVSRDESDRAFAAVVDTSLIHSFDET